MASNINTTDIDAEYPVAGQDNDSQGFRDNFSTIKDNFVVAQDEITTLQSSTAKLDDDNDFNGNQISEANFIAVTEVSYPNDGSTASISFTNGSYQTYTADGNETLSLTDWPTSGKLGKVRVVVTGSGTITFNVAAGSILTDGNAAWTGDAIVADSNRQVIDFWTDNSGTTVFANYVGMFS